MTTKTRAALRGMLLILPLVLLGAPAGLGSTLDSSVDAYIRDAMTQRHIPGLALAVIRQGRVQRVTAYGQASLEFAVPVTSTTLFNVASVTKSFTAVGVMKLVEAGKFEARRSDWDLPARTTRELARRTRPGIAESHLRSTRYREEGYSRPHRRHAGGSDGSASG